MSVVLYHAEAWIQPPSPLTRTHVTPKASILKPSFLQHIHQWLLIICRYNSVMGSKCGNNGNIWIYWLREEAFRNLLPCTHTKRRHSSDILVHASAYLFHRCTCTQTSHRILTLFGLSGRDYNRFSHLGFSHCRIPGEVFLTRSQPASLSLPRIVKIMLIIIVIIEKIYSVSLTTDTDCHKRHYWVCGRNSQATTVEAPLWIDVLQSFKYLIQI